MSDDGISCTHCHTISDLECVDCNKLFCKECDERYHNYPTLETHIRNKLERICNVCEEEMATIRCDECNGWYCRDCDQSRHKKTKANHERKEIGKKKSKEEKLIAVEEAIEKLKDKLTLSAAKDKSQQLSIETLEKEKRELQKAFEKVQSTGHDMLEKLLTGQTEKESLLKTISEQKQQILELSIAAESKEQDLKDMERKLKEENVELQKRVVDHQKQTTDLHSSIKKYTKRFTTLDKEGTWEKYSNGNIPSSDTVEIGDDKDWVVCRAEVDEDWIPGTVISGKGAYVYHNGKEHKPDHYEVLSGGSNFKWISCTADQIPPQAVPGGSTKEEEVLYIGRIKYDGWWYDGKVQPSRQGCCTFPVKDGKETEYHEYEILVWK